jgi:hypothetical protein
MSKWLSAGRITLLLVGFLVAVAGIGSLGQQPPNETEWLDARPPGVPDELFATDQFQRYWWAMTLRGGLAGAVPEGAIDAALAEISGEPAIQDTQPEVLNMRFAAIGPSPILGGQIGTTLPTRAMSGRVTALAADPTNENHWYIGGAQGGVWETKNAGSTWVAKSDAEASLAIGALAIAPGSPNIVYAGTGEPSFSGDSYGGHGLLRSEDGGLNWVRLAQPAFEGLAFARLIVHPEDANTLVGAVTAGALFGREGASSPGLPARGVFRSTDGGATVALTLGGDATDLQTDPTSFDRQLAAIGGLSNPPSNGLYRSTDGGRTWQLVPSTPWATDPRGLGRMQIAIAPSNPNRAFVSIQDGYNGGSLDGALLGFFYTDDVWAATPAWTRINTSATDASTGAGFCGFDAAYNSVARQCWYDQVIIVDPVDPDLVFAGGIPLWSYNVGTNTWIEVGHSTPAAATFNGIHADQHAAMFAGSRLVIGNAGARSTGPARGTITTPTSHSRSSTTARFTRPVRHCSSGVPRTTAR